MAVDFDPYYKWLGIPPKDQPPHYYRLLGIEVFESDAEVIASAADQRLMLVRTFKNGPNVILAQKLEKKIAAAKSCLLDPEKKAEYDVSLRLQLRLQPLPAPPPPPPSSTASPLKQGNYPLPPPLTPTAPPNLADADSSASANPLVAVRESFDLLFKFLRRHKKMVSLIKKLVGAAVVFIIILLVFAHGKDLWTFTFDQTSALVAKITGSSEGKLPERIIKTRTIPGAKPPVHAESTGNQFPETPLPLPGEKTEAAVSPGQSSPVPPPPGPDNTQTLPAATLPADAAANSTLGNSSAVAAANNFQGPPADLSSTLAPEIISLNLPSGKTFKTRLFKINLNSIFELFMDTVKDEQVIFLLHPDGIVSAFAAHDKGVLNGICMAFSEDRQPMVYANYIDGLLDGMLKTWNEKGERVYWCQYEKGVRHGFCCYFKNNQLRLLLEIDRNTIIGVHLCANGALQKSFASAAKAADDVEAQKLLDEVDDLEAEIKTNEIAFKKQIKEEDARLRHEKSGMMSPQKRAAIQDRLNQRVIESQALIKNLRKFPNL